MPVLTTLELNRALLARQHLLARHEGSAVETVEHLVGMQGQAPNGPYVGLWTRLEAFDPTELATALTERRVVRTTLMRATVHLVTAADCFALRPLVDPAIRRQWAGSSFAKALADAAVELDAVTSAGRALLEERPLIHADVARHLAQQWPDADAESLAYAVAFLIPLVQVPPRGVWGTTGPAARTTTDRWLAGQHHAPTSIDAVVLRYLAAFGPATVMDAQTWSGLTRLREVFDRLRPGLETFHDEHGRELYDVPGSPRPDPDTVAPPRFLPEYDNLLLSHKDRIRVIHGRRRVPLPPGNGARIGTFLVDGFLAGTWRLRTARDHATLVVEPYAPLPSSQVEAVEAEGLHLLEFIVADAEDRHVELALLRS